MSKIMCVLNSVESTCSKHSLFLKVINGEEITETEEHIVKTPIGNTCNFSIEIVPSSTGNL